MAEWPAAAGKAGKAKTTPPRRLALYGRAAPALVCPLHGSLAQRFVEKLGRQKMTLLMRHLTNAAMAEGPGVRAPYEPPPVLIVARRHSRRRTFRERVGRRSAPGRVPIVAACTRAAPARFRRRAPAAAVGA